jgi:transketolase
VLCLTRQALPTVRGVCGDNLTARGAYVLREARRRRDLTLIATGSEVALALSAADQLAEEGIAAAVISVPCFELFAEQPAAYQAAVLGTAPRIGIEAAVEGSWKRWLGDHGRFIGMTGFGASAPAETLFDAFGITVAAVVLAAHEATQH